MFKKKKTQTPAWFTVKSYQVSPVVVVRESRTFDTSEQARDYALNALTIGCKRAEILSHNASGDIINVANVTR